MSEFKNFMPSDYYQMKVIENFTQFDKNKINYNTLIYQRNPEKKCKLTLNHLEFIEYLVRLIKPKNFLELGVQFGECINTIINLIPEKYVAVDIKKQENIDYFLNNFSTFEFNETTTDDYFKNYKSDYKFDMIFIDACHTKEAVYQDFLNAKEILNEDGFIIFHDTYPYSEYWTDNGLSGDCYKTSEIIRKKHNNEFEILTIPINPGMSIARKCTKQLNWLYDDFGFIIPCCCKNEIQLKQLKRCVNSIRKFHDNKIILIDDYQEYDLQNEIKDDNMLIIKSEIKGRGECSTYKVFLETKLFQKAIFLHDSMVLRKKITNIEDIKVKFLWHFTHHVREYDFCMELQTEYNIKNNIVNHTDLIRHIVKEDYDTDFYNYTCDMLINKHKWCGCFGSLCIIDYDTLKYVNDKTSFVNKIIKEDKRYRTANESIISILFHYYFPEINFHDSYDGLYYDGYTIRNFRKPVGEDDLLWTCLGDFFGKISFGR